MAFSGTGTSGRMPRVPTLFRGELIAQYATYAQAQRAVDFLSDERFPVQNVAIVGTDLRMVERITGRLTYSRVAAAGALSGIYFAGFVGLLLVLFGTDAALGVFFAALIIGAGLGMLFGVLSYSLTGGRRDFTSASQIVAAQYAVMCAPDVAGQARQVLSRLPAEGTGRGPGAGQGAGQGPGQGGGTAAAGPTAVATPPVATPPVAPPATAPAPPQDTPPAAAP